MEDSLLEPDEEKEAEVCDICEGELDADGHCPHDGGDYDVTKDEKRAIEHEKADEYERGVFAGAKKKHVAYRIEPAIPTDGEVMPMGKAYYHEKPNFRVNVHLRDGGVWVVAKLRQGRRGVVGEKNYWAIGIIEQDRCEAENSHIWREIPEGGGK